MDATTNDPIGFELSRQQRECISSAHGGGFSIVSVPLSTGCDLADIRAQLDIQVQRHEVLRTTLNRTAGLTLPLQNVQEYLPFAWRENVTAVDSLASVIDLERGPVLVAATTPGPKPVLVLVGHPAVADVPTLDRLAQSAITTTPQGPVGDDPIQYAEYAAWQTELTGVADDAANAATAWERIAGDAEPIALPTDTGHPAAASGPLASPPTTVDGPGDVDRWLAAWFVTISRLTGEQVVTLGVELDPRQQDDLADAAGPYVLISPLQVTVPVDGSFEAFCAEVSRLRALASTWVEWAPPSACQVLFGVGSAGSRAARGNFQLELRVDPRGSAEIVPGPSGSTHLAATAAVALTAVLGADLHGPIADVDVLGRQEVEARLAVRTPPASTGHILEHIARAAASAPQRVSVTDGTLALTYAQLMGRIDGLASALVGAGATSSAPVALGLPRSSDFIVAMLAAQRTGAGYLPLDLDQPESRIEQQLQAAGSQVVITEGSGAADDPAGSGGTAVSGTAFGRTAVPVTASAATALPSLTGDEAAYVIFTSGSTGVPKGVRVPARALTNYAAAIADLTASVAESRPLTWALMSSPVTDLGNTAIFAALFSGGTLHVVPGPVARDPRRFAEYHAAHPIDVMKITPSHLGSLLVDESADVLPAQLLLLGGEALPWTLVGEIRRRGSCRIANHYGPTETTVGVLTNLLSSIDAQVGTVPIGHPLPGTETLLLDARRRLVAPGAIGEVAIAGAGLADGYVGDPAGTAERFVPHPYRDGERIYLTGDLARQDDTGAVCFLGRRDGQVKIRGYRVEVGEIEAALRAHASIRQAAVVLRADDHHDPALTGYVVVQVDPGPTEHDLQDHLRSLLPEHMVPARIVRLEALPLRPNGKLDTAALPAPSANTAASVSPATETEATVAAIFAEVLQVPSVGVTDDFFALGGHSLQATKIIVAVRTALGADLPVYSLFETPTVRGIAELADRERFAAIDQDELRRMIAELDGLSDEEATALLALENGSDTTAGPGTYADGAQ